MDSVKLVYNKEKLMWEINKKKKFIACALAEMCEEINVFKIGWWKWIFHEMHFNCDIINIILNLLLPVNQYFHLILQS